MINDEISESFLLTSETRHDCLLLLLLFNMLVNAFEQKKEMRDIKYWKGGGKITAFCIWYHFIPEKPKRII